MMRIETDVRPLRLPVAVAFALLLPAGYFCAQTAPKKTAPTGTALTVTAKDSSGGSAQSEGSTTEAPNRAVAYYHSALAAIYEDEASSLGHSEYATRAVEEYKLALNADPSSNELREALASLYFRIGRLHDAEATAKELIRISPDNLDAHQLLGRIYLRQISESQSRLSSSTSNSSSENSAVDLAIAEFEKIVSLAPKSVEDRMVLGQLYTIKREDKKAEEQFNIAKSIEPDSEEVILNLVHLFAENGDMTRAVKVIEDISESDRTAKMELALGAAYDQMKQPKKAIEAYRRANGIEPDDERTMETLAQALLSDSQFDEALKVYKDLSAADPENASAFVHIGEILRRQQKYEDALAAIRKAQQIDANSLEAGYNEGLLLDVLGRYDEAAKVYQRMVELTSHANGAYTTEEKNNRAIFLDRLGTIYHEQNKVNEAIDVYQKMIELGSDTEVRGYQNQVDIYRDARQFDKAVEVSRKAVEVNPKNRDLKLMLASELTDVGKTEEGLTMAKSLLANNNDDRQVWLALAQMYTRLRRWKEADEALTKVTSLTTKKEDRLYLYFMKGEVAERQKHIDTAEQYFRQALDLEPDSAMTLNYLGYMLADKGLRLPEALKMIRRAVELEPTNGAYLDSLGWIYFKMGEYELAEVNLRQAVERDQTDPTVHDHLGDLYEKTGRIRLAAAQWEISLSQYAKSASADVEPGDVTKVQHKLESARVRLAKQENVVAPVKP
jgi:tetratricopeptide (TPR) repeat protein